MRIGRFEVEAEAGRGASSRVYRATDPATGEVVAVKQLVGGVPAEVRARLQAEIGVLTGLDHPHVVRLVDAGLDDDPPWLAQAWVDGLTLEQLLQVHGRLTAEQACGVLLGAAQGLGHAHSRRLLHRDVSPGNVLLDGSGTAMLVDFGLAAPVGSSGAVGTPAFVSPETASGLSVSPRSDVYAAGAVLFLLLEGRPPFPGADVDRVLAAHREQPPPPLTGDDDGLADLVGRCLAKDPLARPADGAALAAELEEQAQRRFGAGWLARASVAGLVAAAAAAGSGEAAAPATTPRGARDTVLLTTAAASTGVTPAPEPQAAADPADPAAPDGPLHRRRSGPPRRVVAVAVAVAAAVVVAAAAAAVAVVGGDDPGDDGGQGQDGTAAGPDGIAGLYTGTARGTVTLLGKAEEQSVETGLRVTCDAEDACSVGIATAGSFPLEPQGDGAYRISREGVADPCAAGSGPAEGTVTFEGDTMLLRLVEEGHDLVDCGGGRSQASPEVRLEFTGTRTDEPDASG